MKKQLFVLSSIISFLSVNNSHADKIIHNPYTSVSSSYAFMERGNLHTHTNRSPSNTGTNDLATIVNAYHNKSGWYEILAITDQSGPGECSSTTWPWSSFLNPGQTLPSSIMPIRGTEITNLQNNTDGKGRFHIGSLFSSYYNSTSRTSSTIFNGIGALNGIAIINHPSRYSTTTAQYLAAIQSYSCIVGMEVIDGFNWTNNETQWDAVLTASYNSQTPKDVWGFANDDVHSSSSEFKAWNCFALPDNFTENDLKSTIKEGAFCFSYNPNQSGEAPIITAIGVIPESQTIWIRAEEYNNIKWVTSGNQVIGTSEFLTIPNSANYKYVRAVLTYDFTGGTTYTQPFSIKDE